MDDLDNFKPAILEHAESEFPNECCGVVIGSQYFKCDNVSDDPENKFKFDNKQIDALEDRFGRIRAYVHSHPNASARPSEYDLIKIEQFKKPWIICSWPEGQITYNEPYGYKPKLIGRNFHHGWQDCYSLIRDFYDRELGITLKNYDRDDKWWENPDAEPLYLKNFTDAGFVEVDTPKYGDVILFSIHSTHSNHAGIYLESNGELKSERSESCIGHQLFLHHMYGRKSVREIFSAYWMNRATHYLRYKENT